MWLEWAAKRYVNAPKYIYFQKYIFCFFLKKKMDNASSRAIYSSIALGRNRKFKRLLDILY